MPPPSHIARQNRRMSAERLPNPGASCVPSTATDCAATTATSQPPLIPSANVGLLSLTVSTAKTPYVIAAHKATPAAHNDAATRQADAMTSHWLPSTHVAATVVRNPTARP